MQTMTVAGSLMLSATHPRYFTHASKDTATNVNSQGGIMQHTQHLAA